MKWKWLIWWCLFDLMFRNINELGVALGVYKQIIFNISIPTEVITLVIAVTGFTYYTINMKENDKKK